MPSGRKNRPHVESLLTDLTVAVYGQMLDRLNKRSSQEHDERVRSISVKLLRQGMTPIELAIELSKMKQSAEELYGFFSKKPGR